MSRPRLICLFLVLITLVVYLPVRRHGFTVYDDGDYVSQNHIVQAGLTWPGVKWAFTTWFASNWHPLTWLSHMTDCECFGLDAGAHHLVNALFHAANAALLFVLLLRLTGAAWPAALVAALFAWHPLRVESVAWVSERKDVLSSFFALLSLLCYTRFAREKSRRDYFLSLLCFALGLLAKPMIVTLPCLFLLLDWWPLNRLANPAAPARSLARLAWEKWPFFALTAASCVVTFFAQRAVAVLSVDQYPVSLRLGNAVLSYVKYLVKIIWPANLSIMYPLPDHLPWLRVAAAGLVLAVVCWLVWRARQRQPYLLLGWLWFLGTLVPVIGLVQTGQQAMADRYSYFPSIGIFLAMILGLRDLAKGLKLAPAPLATAAALVLAANVALTEHQLGFWRDDLSLFGHAVAVTRDNAAAQINLGIALEDAGAPDQAEIHYREAVRISPTSARAHNNLANLLDTAGHNEAALAEYQAALRLNPDAPLTHCNLGTLLVKLGRFDEARAQYEEAARLQPDDSRPYYLQGKACLRQGQYGEAVAQFRHAVELNPDDFQSLAFWARTLATCDDAKIRDGAQAVTLAEKANALSGGQQPFILDILALAYAEAGRFDDARQTATSAVDLAKAGHLPDLAAGIQRHLEQFQRNQPCRDIFTNAPAASP
jgi:tetratricopeptide (TPR) repeat protein